MNEAVSGRVHLAAAQTLAVSAWQSVWFQCVIGVSAVSIVAVILVYLGVTYHKSTLEAAKTILQRHRAANAAIVRRKQATRCTSMSVNMEGGMSERMPAPRLKRSHSLECHIDGVYMSGVYSTETPAMVSRRSEPTLSCTQTSTFPFQRLPVHCQLRVFRLLSAHDRGVAARVCQEWARLMRSCSIWHEVDLTPMPTSGMRYAVYRSRAKLFLAYLQAVRPAVRKLAFTYDIADAADDGWLPSLEQFLSTARCDELQVAHLNWAETLATTVSESATWTASDYAQLQFRHRRRQRRFVSFFDAFVAAAPNVRSLRLPFDWSTRSLQALCRLPKLESLVLEKYFAVQRLEASSLTALLSGAPHLTRLHLHVCAPSATGTLAYDLHHARLTHLDMSQCRGIRLGHISLPRLASIVLSTNLPCYLPIASAAPHELAVHCVYEVLCHGAPRLKKINGVTLSATWRDVVDDKLDLVLREVCTGHPHT